jgi:DNA (cytosine-5)-methyltransferase 1
MKLPVALDLFCKAGGATKGLQRAGFKVVGIDIEPQSNYCGDHFIQADALRVPVRLEDFDLVWASPPCQAFTQMSARWRGKNTRADEHGDLLTPIRKWFAMLSVPWVIENVVGARRMMAPTLLLHGGMFGLGVHRPRLFESNLLILCAPMSATRFPVGVYGTKPDGRTTYRYRNNGNYRGKSLIRAAKSIEEARLAMGIDWMSWDEIREAIPPAYSEFIGRAVLAQTVKVERRIHEMTL